MIWILLFSLLLSAPAYAQHAVTRDWPMQIIEHGQAQTPVEQLTRQRMGLLRQRYTPTWFQLSPAAQQKLLSQIDDLNKQIAALGGPPPPAPPPSQFMPKAPPPHQMLTKKDMLAHVPAAPWQVLMAKKVGVEREIHFEDHDKPNPAHQHQLDQINAQMHAAETR